MLKLPALAALLVSIHLAHPARGETPTDTPSALARELSTVIQSARAARDSVSRARMQMIPLVITRAELQETVRIHRDEFALRLRAARAAYTPPRPDRPATSPPLDVLELARSEYAEVLRLGGTTSAAAERLAQTEEALDRLLRSVEDAATRAWSARVRARRLARDLNVRARTAAWNAARTKADSEATAAADLTAVAVAAAREAKQAEVASLAAAREAIRCRSLVRLAPKNAAVRRALAEAARNKLLLEFAAAKATAKLVASAIEEQLAERQPSEVPVPSSAEPETAARLGGPRRGLSVCRGVTEPVHRQPRDARLRPPLPLRRCEWSPGC